MDATFIAAQIANYGFPMVLSWYLLVRMESKLEALTAGINALRDCLKELTAA